MLVTLGTRRLKLRPFRVSDAQAMFDGWASDPEVTKFLTWCTHDSAETTRQLLEKWVSEYEKPEKLNFAIELKETGKLIGGIDVVGYIDGPEGTPVIGYNLSSRHWNKGYMTEACRCVVRYLLDRGYQKVRIDAMINNAGSNRVIQKCGGIFQGKEEHHRPLKGDTVEINCYLITNDSFIQG
ncbi:MAG: GNAT family N-acetyltransferase [Oscillospiraceae bacterium]|nr:GNAT family N-acetyltransferase [Oscillospiraceae bacterium]